MEPATISVPPAGPRSVGPAGAHQTSPRLAETLHKHDVAGERAIALAQGGIASFVLLLHILAQFGKGNGFGNAAVMLTLAVLAGSSLLRLRLTQSPKLPEHALAVLNAIDIALFLALLWTYQFAYQHPAGGVLKSPSLVLLFVLVALRALRFHPGPVLVAGTTAIVGWLLVVAATLDKDGSGAITRDYVTYLTSYKILIGAEVERLVALGALAAFLAIAATKARGILSAAAHASDYAEALDAAQAHLQAAMVARQKAESAAEQLGRRDAEISTQNDRFNAALANMSQGLCMFDKDMRLLVCNERYIEMYDLPGELALPGTPFRSILEHRVTSGVYTGEPERYIEERLAAVREVAASVKIHELHDGRVVAIAHRPLRDGGWLATHDDITEQQRAKARIDHMARHDALTDLPNRVQLRQRIADMLGDASRAHRPFAVLALDLDRFKEVNDTLGHSVGDALLKLVGKRIHSTLNEGDMVARMGGDEFVVVRLADDAVADARVLAKALQYALAAPILLEGHETFVGACVGIAIAPDDGADADELLKSVDLALHHAKSEGSGQVHFYEAGMDQNMLARRVLEHDLRNALSDSEFELYYQPVVNLERNDISGFEALLRWRHPVRGLVPPAEFVPMAEETGLIVPIGEWTIRQACLAAARWPQHIKVAVNISAVHFKSGNLVHTVLGALAASGLPASRLELEITETVLLQNDDSAGSILQKLHDLGVRMALDDFGTGYSSLAYLRSFPFHKIKIDRSFIADLAESSEEALAIIRSVARLGISLGLEITAEGVENEHQLEVVRAEGCTEMQGYYFSAPRPADEIERLFLRKPLRSASAA